MFKGEELMIEDEGETLAAILNGVDLSTHDANEFLDEIANEVLENREQVKWNFIR